jgi:hypothetical protein
MFFSAYSATLAGFKVSYQLELFLPIRQHSLPVKLTILLTPAALVFAVLFGGFRWHELEECTYLNFFEISPPAGPPANPPMYLS